MKCTYKISIIFQVVLLSIYIEGLNFYFKETRFFATKPYNTSVETIYSYPPKGRSGLV